MFISRLVSLLDSWILHHGQYVKTKVEKEQHEQSLVCNSSKLIKNVNTFADEMVKKKYNILQYDTIFLQVKRTVFRTF